MAKKSAKTITLIRREKIMAICDYCNQEMSISGGVKSCTQVVEFPSGETLPAIPWDGEEPCRDCNVQPRGLHHPGCDSEECPRCHGQLIACGCLDEDEENEDED